MPFLNIHVLNRYARILEVVRRHRRIYVLSVAFVSIIILGLLATGAYFLSYKDPYPLSKVFQMLVILLFFVGPPFLWAIIERKRASNELLHFWTEMLIRNYLIPYLLDPTFLNQTQPKKTALDESLDKLEWRLPTFQQVVNYRFSDFWGLRSGWTNFSNEWTWRLLELHPHFEVIPVVNKLMRRPLQVFIRVAGAFLGIGLIIMFFGFDMPNFAKLVIILLWWNGVYNIMSHAFIWSLSSNIVKAVLMMVCMRDFNYDYPLSRYRGLDFHINFEDLYDIIENEINPVKVYMPTSRLRTDRSQYI